MIYFSISVIFGSIFNVTHLDERSQTNINIRISNVITKREPLFSWPVKKKGPYTRETLIKHRRCNVSYGQGEYLFTGRWRLGQIEMLCSSKLKDWNIALERAIQSGEMKCSGR